MLERELVDIGWCADNSGGKRKVLQVARLRSVFAKSTDVQVPGFTDWMGRDEACADT